MPPDVPRIGETIVISATAEAVMVQRPKTQTLVMSARRKSLLPDRDEVPARCQSSPLSQDRDDVSGE